jgi:membrane-associated phospholipid phosphatase
MRIRSLSAAALLLTATQAARAQSVGNMLKDDFQNLGKDVVAIWASPFHASSRDWALTAASFGAFGVSMLADQSISDWAIRNDSSTFFRSISAVRRGGKLFSGKYVIPPVAAVYVIGIATKNQDLRDFVMGCMASWGAQSAVRKGIYQLVGRARPDTMSNDPQHWKVFSGGTWQMHSFPAGHFANAVACATYWNKRFRLGPAGLAAYALAGAVGVGRLADKAHWTSDTFIGGVLGYAVGKEVARRSVARLKPRMVDGTSFNVSPGADGLTFNVRWTF